MRSRLAPSPSSLLPAADGADAELRVSQGWSWPEAENRRLDTVDFSSFDFDLGLRELLVPLVAIVAVTTTLTVWLLSGR
jgi:hypothetical protein